MCDQCAELDRKIAHFRRLAIYFNDKQSLVVIEEMIVEFETQKRALHPPE